MSKLNKKELADIKIANHIPDTCFICGRKLTEKDDVVEREHFKLGIIKICSSHI